MLPSRIFFDNFLDDIEPRKLDKMIRCDIYEEDNVYHIVMDVPGISKEDMEIEFEKGNLKITVSKEEATNDNRKYLCRERTSFTKMSRSFYLGEIDHEEIKAEFQDGILKISVPKEKKEEDCKKIISIN